jgi:Ca2+-binding EF-hand superfamily protein
MTTAVGLIDSNDMETILGIISPKSPPLEVKQRVDAANTNDFGMIDYAEFRSWISRTDAQLLFKMFDIDGNGVIDGREIGTVLKALDPTWTPEKVQKILEEADLNKDGTIDYEQFLAWTFQQAVEVEAENNNEQDSLEMPLPQKTGGYIMDDDVNNIDLAQWNIQRSGTPSAEPRTPIRTSEKQLDFGSDPTDVLDLAERLVQRDPSLTLDKARAVIENAQRSLVVFPSN